MRPVTHSAPCPPLPPAAKGLISTAPIPSSPPFPTPFLFNQAPPRQPDAPIHSDACEWETYPWFWPQTPTNTRPRQDGSSTKTSSPPRKPAWNGATSSCTAATAARRTSRLPPPAPSRKKGTTTQRFVLPGNIEVDAECDCRLCFFREKIPSSSEDVKTGGRHGSSAIGMRRRG